MQPHKKVSSTHSKRAVQNGQQARTPMKRRKTGRRKRGVTEDEDVDGGVTMVTVDDGEQPEGKRQRKPAEIAMENFALSVAKKSVEGLKTEFREIHNYHPADQSALVFHANRSKNRYHNVVCFDRTRVILTYNVPPDTDYIHANWTGTNLAKLTNRYICTQGPTDHSVNDFWRMIYQEKVKHIVMLCGIVENGKPKCAQYYPEHVEESKVYGTVTVKFKKNSTAPDEKIYESLLFSVSVEGQDSFQLTLMRWLDWPDFSIPNSGMGMLRILRVIRDCPESTAVVHCSAGVGRTGTMIGTELCLRILTEGKELNVVEVVKELRSQRAGSIQTESQYIYMHRALCEYIYTKRLCREEMSTFFKAFSAYRQAMIKPGVASPLPTTLAPTSPLATPPSPSPSTPQKREMSPQKGPQK